MRTQELGDILKNKCDNALQVEKVTQIYLFAIFHAQEIKQNNYSISEIVRHSTIHESFKTKVSKSIKLAKYVEIGINNRSLKYEKFYRVSTNIEVNV